MVEKFSQRALRVIFEARVSAGDRGASSIQVVDMAVGFVRHDQGVTGLGRYTDTKTLTIIEPHPLLAAEEYHSLLSESDATDLLQRLNDISSHATPHPTDKDLPIGEGVKRLLVAADAIRADFGHTHTRPLHLLAATFRSDSPTVISELIAAGITESNVLARLRLD